MTTRKPRKRRAQARTVYIASEQSHARPSFRYKGGRFGFEYEATAYGRSVAEAEGRAREAFEAARSYLAKLEAGDAKKADAKIIKQLEQSVEAQA